jgi:hypothetical protein
MNLAGGLWCVGGAHWRSVYQMPAKKSIEEHFWHSVPFGALLEQSSLARWK